MIVFFTSNIIGSEICFSAGGDHIAYSSMLAADKTKLDNFLSIFDGNVGMVVIKNVPGDGLVDISFAVPSDGGRIEATEMDYDILSATHQGYVTDFIGYVTS